MTMKKIKTVLVKCVLLSFGFNTGSALAEWQWSSVNDLGDQGGRALPQVSVEPKSGHATVVWLDDTNAFESKIRAANYSDGNWQPADTVSQGQGKGWPQVAMVKKGGATVVWNESGSSGYVLSGATWNPMRNQWRVTTSNAKALEYQIVKNKNGVATIIWLENMEDYTVLRASRMTASGKWMPSSKIAQGLIGSDYGVTIAGNGVITVVWSQPITNAYQIKSSQFRNGKWTVVRNVSTPDKSCANSEPGESCIDGLPRVAVDGKGNLAAVWQRFRSDDLPVEILVAQFKNGKWGGEKKLGSAGDRAGFPQIVSDAKGNLTAVWDYTNPNASPLAVSGYVKASQLAYRGSQWTDPVILGPLTSINSKPQLVMDNLGNTTVAWEDIDSETSQWRIVGVHQDTGRWGEPVDLCTSCSSPSLGVDNAGVVTAVWSGVEKIQSRRGSE